MSRRAVTVAIAVAALAGRARAGLPIVKDSPSDILRATHIAIVEIVAATDDGKDAEQRPLTTLDVKAIEVLKGRFAAPTAEARVVHYPPGSPATARLYGAWSYIDLPAGARFVVFSTATTDALADAIVDPNAIAIAPAADAADDVRLAIAVDGHSIDGALARAAPRAAEVHALFASYVLARPHRPRDADALARFVELPALADDARTTIVMEAEQWATADPGARDRLALALFRLLSLDAAQPLRDNLIDTWLPNLIGLDGGETPRTAAQVFRKSPKDRARARAALRAYRGPAKTGALLDWLR